MKQTIKLTEAQLHNVIKESVKRVVKEEKEDFGRDGDYFYVDKGGDYG